MFIKVPRVNQLEKKLTKVQVAEGCTGEAEFLVGFAIWIQAISQGTTEAESSGQEEKAKATKS